MISVSRINIHQANDMLKNGDMTLIDIRDSGSYREAHIERAILVNDDNIESFLKNVNRSKPLICYCYHGNNSQMAVDYLQQNGFAEVFSIDGGFEEWRTVYPTVSDENNNN